VASDLGRGYIGVMHWWGPALAISDSTRSDCGCVGPRPSFGEPWSCLTIFGTSTGWLKMKHQAKWILRDLAPFCGIFGFRVYVTGMGCQPMGFTHVQVPFVNYK
jgi:hypothetical protein